MPPYPIIQEFAHSIAPHVFEYSGTDEEFTSGGFVTVDLGDANVSELGNEEKQVSGDTYNIGDGDARDSGDLNTNQGKADDDNYFPRPSILEPDAEDNRTNDGANSKR